MGQFSFFDADKRLAAISAKGDPLEMVDRVVPFESFRAEIEAVVLTPAREKKSNAGRKPIDVIVMFRMLVLQSLYNLSDEQVEYQVRDRLSFTRFLRLGFEDSIPDGTTLWLFRETLAKAGLIERLFELFGRHLEAKGYIARGGQMVDATIVPVPKQRNSREENEAVKAGETPEEWEKNPGQEPTERQGCALDQEARQELFRLQEPHQCGCPAQADPAVWRDQCERPRQSEIRSACEQGQHVCGRLRRQRLSIC
jgi:transposase, IS5 family